MIDALLEATWVILPPEMANLLFGEVVPMPMLPVLSITKCETVEEPTANSGEPTARLLTLTESFPQGEEVPIPSRLFVSSQKKFSVADDCERALSVEL